MKSKIKKMYFNFKLSSFHENWWKKIIALKTYISFRDKEKCQICNEDLKEYTLEKNIDHIIPRSLFAISELWNLQLLCTDCNREKGSSLISDFRDRCKKNRNPATSIINNSENKNNFQKTLEGMLIASAAELEYLLPDYYDDEKINYNNYGHISGSNEELKDMVMDWIFNSEKSNFKEIMMSRILSMVASIDDPYTTFNVISKLFTATGSDPLLAFLGILRES